VLAGALVALVERDAPNAGPADPSRAEPAAAVALTPAATVQDRSRA
jgi:hypothetical protein